MADNQKLVVIRTAKEVRDLAEYIRQAKNIVTYDTETTGVTKDCEIIGYSICCEANVGYYVVISEWNKDKQALDYLGTKTASNQVLRALQDKPLVMHNAIFDCIMTKENFGIDLMPSVHTDTMILAHLLDENRRVGLKDLGEKFYGESAKQEQAEMKASVEFNGGTMTKACYELYKGHSELIARYGAKDAILTYNIFHELLPQLIEEGLDKFFYEEESMPLLRGPTYDLNSTGLKVNMEGLATLKKQLEADMHELKAYIDHEIREYVKEKYPATSINNTFNWNSGEQLSWLLFEKLRNKFVRVGDTGKELCEFLNMRTPYSDQDKKNFKETIVSAKGQIWKGKTKIKDYWAYLSVDKSSLANFKNKYEWVKKLLEYKKLDKILKTYVIGIEERTQYGVIRPNFLQHGTTSGRYSCKNPNFQNLPRDDKRIKAIIIPRPGKVFVGADHSQLEPRVFASISQDERLMESFAKGEDFYSIVGAPIFDKYDCSMIKSDPDSFANKYPKLRDMAKVIALATPYGRTAMQQAMVMNIKKEESQELIDLYFSAYPKVKAMMLESHEMAKKEGYVKSIFGRPRRIPEAKDIARLFGRVKHEELRYDHRSLLNLAMNHRVQSTGASIVNRNAITLHSYLKKANIDAKIVMQCHDSLIAECEKKDANDVAILMQYAMESSVTLPGVKLQAIPKIGNNLAEV